MGESARGLDSPNTGLRNESFRAYADHTRSQDFRTAHTEVLADATEQRTAIMCAESVWWRCHRRLIADVVVLLHGLGIRHLMHDGQLSRHVPTDITRVKDGAVVDDAGPPSLPV